MLTTYEISKELNLLDMTFEFLLSDMQEKVINLKEYVGHADGSEYRYACLLVEHLDGIERLIRLTELYADDMKSEISQPETGNVYTDLLDFACILRAEKNYMTLKICDRLNVGQVDTSLLKQYDGEFQSINEALLNDKDIEGGYDEV